jgi:hypothetical protein
MSCSSVLALFNISLYMLKVSQRVYNQKYFMNHKFRGHVWKKMVRKQCSHKPSLHILLCYFK